MPSRQKGASIHVKDGTVISIFVTYRAVLNGKKTYGPG